MTWHVLAEQRTAVCMGHLPEIPGVQANHVEVKGRPVTLVPHDWQNYQALKQHGVTVPVPMYDYDWPGRFKPREYQLRTVEFLLEHRKAFCLNGLGTGKTLCGVWAMDYAMQQGAVRRVLIVAPKTICSHVWERELFKTLPNRKAVVLHGSAIRKRQMARDTRFDVIICNPESLHLILKDLVAVDLILVDEFTKFKNARSRRWKALRAASISTRLWLFSGTPAPQGPLDAHGPIALVRTDRFPYLRWRDQTMTQITSFKWMPKPDAEQTISKYMQPAIRYRREDCYDMPDVDVQELEVDLTQAQEKAIEGFKREAAARFENDKTITATTAAAALSKILQVMGGGVYDEDGDVLQVDSAPFFEAVEEVVDQADTPVVIFLPFRSSAQAVHQHLQKAGYRAAIIMGGVNNRSEIFDQFKRGKLDALVAVAGTMSHGVDGLQERGRYVLWAQPPYSYEEYEQANGRLVRSGQENNVIIYHLVQNPLARELFSRLNSKRKLQDTVLDLIGGTNDDSKC